MSEIPKAYEPQAVETKWYQFWLDQKCFVANARSPKPAYSIVIPPPNVTGVLHMGHVLNNTIQDILSRKARMDGKEVLWLPGTDHAGIATQVMVEKQLRKEEKKTRHDLGREPFLERVWKWKEKHGNIIIQQLKKLGCSCDWSRERFTMDPEYSRCVQKVFVALYRKGLIYRGNRMVNWDPAARTALSDEEVEMIEEKGHLWHLKYPLLDDQGRPKANEFLVVATTRPETMLGDEAVAVNPNDPRYRKIVGRKCLLPLQNKPIPIIADELVDPKFGTGCVKVTPAHDPADYQIAARHKLPFTVVIGPDGAMTSAAGEDFDGMDRMEARQAVVEELTELGLLLKTEDYVHNVGYSQRSHVPIEPRLSEQWFLKYPAVDQSRACVVQAGERGQEPDVDPQPEGLREISPGQRPGIPSGINPHPGGVPDSSTAPAGAAAISGHGGPRALPGANFHQPGGLEDKPSVGQLRFHPQRWAKVYDHWLGNIQDWCISRQLWWGHRIPVWYKKSKVQSPKPKAQGPKSEGGAGEIWCDVEPPADPENWEQDPDVLDTWFSSWLWPFATMGWTGDKSQDAKNTTLRKFYPTSDLVTGPDIIFFWVARMIMAGYEFMGDLPFRNVYFTGIIRDKQGRKMSKTLGNSPDPLELISQYGADALRFGTMRSAPLGQDVLFDVKDVELGRNFCNKLWNACRFRQMQSSGGGASAPVQGEIDPQLLTSDDKWILFKLDRAIREITAAFAEYKFNEATATLYRFFWSEYCDWYVEASKATLARPGTALNRGTATTAKQSSPSPLGGERAGVRGEEGASCEVTTPPHPDPLPPAARGGEGDARRLNTLAVIDFVLSHTLRLFHPFLPFITEELWRGMGYAEDMPENQGGKTIMFAPWPKPFDDDFKAHYRLTADDEPFVEARNELVVQGRNLRRTGNIPASKKVKYIFKPARRMDGHDVEVMRLLLNAETLEVNPTYEPAKGTPAVRTSPGELCLPLEGQRDLAAEKARLTKELEKIEAELAKAEQKLANPNFAQKAPPPVLAEHKKRLAEWQTKREHVKKALEAL